MSQAYSEIVPIKNFGGRFDPYDHLVDSNVPLPNLRNGKEKVAEEYGKTITIPKSNEFSKQFNEEAFQLGSDEITAIRNEITAVLRWSSKSPKIITTRNIGKGYMKYEYWEWKDVLPPRYSLDFARGDAVKTKKEKTTKNLIGLDYDFHLTMPQMDVYQSSNGKVNFRESLLQGNLRELTASLATYRESVIMRGNDIPDLIDHGGNGLLNGTGVQDPGAISGDDWTTAGDVYEAATIVALELITAKFDPPFILSMSPGVYAQALKNKEGTPKVSDFELILKLSTGKNAMFSDILMNPFHLDTYTETNATGSMACFKSGVQNFEVVEAYPLGYYPMPSLDLGLDGKLLWAGATTLYQPTAVVFTDGITINTLAS